MEENKEEHTGPKRRHSDEEADVQMKKARIHYSHGQDDSQEGFNIIGENEGGDDIGEMNITEKEQGEGGGITNDGEIMNEVGGGEKSYEDYGGEKINEDDGGGRSYDDDCGDNNLAEIFNHPNINNKKNIYCKNEDTNDENNDNINYNNNDNINENNNKNDNIDDNINYNNNIDINDNDNINIGVSSSSVGREDEKEDVNSDLKNSDGCDDDVRGVGVNNGDGSDDGMSDNGEDGMSDNGDEGRSYDGDEDGRSYKGDDGKCVSWKESAESEEDETVINKNNEMEDNLEKVKKDRETEDDNDDDVGGKDDDEDEMVDEDDEGSNHNKNNDDDDDEEDESINDDSDDNEEDRNVIKDDDDDDDSCESCSTCSSDKEPDDIESVKMQILVSNFSEDQLNRYTLYRRSTFPRAAVKRLMTSVAGVNVPQNLVIAMAGIAKVLAAQVIETALDVQDEWGDGGGTPTTPHHIREALRRVRALKNLTSTKFKGRLL